VNEMAVELCKVNLWLEALDPGRPLSFLDQRIQCGNSLLGATPALLRRGIPDDAFNPIEGDDPEQCRFLKRSNHREREGFQSLVNAEPWERVGDLARGVAALEEIDDSTIDGVHQIEMRYAEIVRSTSYENGRLWADTWCAAFVWLKTKDAQPLTEDMFRIIERNQMAAPEPLRNGIRGVAKQYRFFHWHLAFPEVFHAVGADKPLPEGPGWSGGFDVVLGNPPWERITILGKEWFAEQLPEITAAPNAGARQLAIQRLAGSDPDIHRRFTAEKRRAATEKVLARDSGLYPLCGRGDVNLSSLFSELAQRVLSPTGFSGLILPTGIATTKTTALFFEALVSHRNLVSIFDFDNRGGAFPAVQGNVRFCLFTTSQRGTADRFVAASFLFSTQDLNTPGRKYELTLADLRIINPNTVSCPMFASTNDAELIKFIFRNVPIFLRTEDGRSTWRIELKRMFHMGDDIGSFRTREQLTEAGFELVGNIFRNDSDFYLPLYESKLAVQFNHRAATFEGILADRRFGTHPATVEVTTSELRDPMYGVIPRYWMSSVDAEKKLSLRDGLLSFRNAISATADSRSLVVAIIPRYPAGHSLNFIYADSGGCEELYLAGCLNSFVVDYILRQKASGGNASFFIVEQLPVMMPRDPQLLLWLLSRVIELTYTAWDLEAYAASCGWQCPPFKWDEQRRFLLRCELDAMFFRLYLPSTASGAWYASDNDTTADIQRLSQNFQTPRQAVAYILDAFPIIRRSDEEIWGAYRTKDTILKIYDRMQRASETGQPYQTMLDPPPADRRCCHPKNKVGILAFGSLVHDPGQELKPKIAMRIKTKTPFGIEYGRYSGKTRGGAPTLVPHPRGSPVAAEILVLNDDVSIEEATNMLWRRETGMIGTGETYTRGTSPNSVLVERFADDGCVETVLYTDFNADGKIDHPAASALAEHAIRSVTEAQEGKDGITYLADAISCGIETPLTSSYRAEILRRTGTTSLQEALKSARDAAARTREASAQE
jgi:hypothetical protein